MIGISINIATGSIEECICFKKSMDLCHPCGHNKKSDNMSHTFIVISLLKALTGR